MATTDGSPIDKLMELMAGRDLRVPLDRAIDMAQSQIALSLVSHATRPNYSKQIDLQKSIDALELLTDLRDMLSDAEGS